MKLQKLDSMPSKLGNVVILRRMKTVLKQAHLE